MRSAAPQPYTPGSRYGPLQFTVPSDKFVAEEMLIA